MFNLSFDFLHFDSYRYKSKHMFSFFNSTSSIQCEDLVPPKASDLDNLTSDLTVVQIIARTKLGWISWKERESSLCRLFERLFDCGNCCIKFTDTLETVIIELEVSMPQLKRLSRLYKSKALATEIGNCDDLCRDQENPN